MAYSFNSCNRIRYYEEEKTAIILIVRVFFIVRKDSSLWIQKCFRSFLWICHPMFLFSSVIRKEMNVSPNSVEKCFRFFFLSSSSSSSEDTTVGTDRNPCRGGKCNYRDTEREENSTTARNVKVENQREREKKGKHKECAHTLRIFFFFFFLIHLQRSTNLPGTLQSSIVAVCSPENLQNSALPEIGSRGQHSLFFFFFFCVEWIDPKRKPFSPFLYLLFFFLFLVFCYFLHPLNPSPSHAHFSPLSLLNLLWQSSEVSHQI